MKKCRAYLIIIILIFLIGSLAGFFWFRSGVNIAPVIFSPSEDIVQQIEEAEQREQSQELPFGEPVTFPLQLPEDFRISIFAKNLGPVRVLKFDLNGTLVATITKGNKVVALPDKNQDGVADGVITFSQNLNLPHGLAFHQNYLYIAETDKVSRFVYDPENLTISQKKVLFSLPAGGGHFTRTIGLDNKGNLYTSVGSSCNVCNEKDWRRAKILISSIDGKNLRVFAEGLRNAVFFVFHPETKEMWATEMGRDWLGNDLPPDEIVIVKEGKDYGWPICYGKNIHDTDFDKNVYVRNPCEDKESSFIDIPAHSAPLGLALADSQWGSEYEGDLFVAFHGSWNRSVPTGYKIVRYDFEDGELKDVQDFISGFLKADGTSLGRPAEVIMNERGEMFISDDKAGVIYRVFKKDAQ